MRPPNVLILSGHDPSGGAGLQADIEAVAANGGHAASVITALTRQDTRNVYAVSPVDDRFFAECIDTVTADMPLAAIKTGVLASRAQVETVARLAAARPELPLVIDPVLTAAGGGELAADPVGQAAREFLFRRATLITPNAGEARRLCDGEADIDRCGAALARHGCHVLITGGDENYQDVINHLYGPDGSSRTARWPRLEGRFHGSGCTLAASIATRLALGDALDQAVARGQEFTWHALKASFPAGQGQAIPNRWPSRGA